MIFGGNRHLYGSKIALDESQILSELPASLRNEAHTTHTATAHTTHRIFVQVSTYLVADLMRSVQVFKDLPPLIWAKIIPLLRPCHFEPNEIVCVQSDTTDEGFIFLKVVTLFLNILC